MIPYDYEEEYEKQLKKEVVRLRADKAQLLAACETVVELLDSEILIRNTARDGDRDWVFKQIPIIQKLALLPEAIRTAKEPL
jgi:hypothetical protein